jgi:hypothetical protein
MSEICGLLRSMVQSLCKRAAEHLIRNHDRRFLQEYLFFSARFSPPYAVLQHAIHFTPVKKGGLSWSEMGKLL